MACRDRPFPGADQLHAVQTRGAGGARRLHRPQPGPRPGSRRATLRTVSHAEQGKFSGVTSQSNKLPVGALIVLAAIGFTAITTELLPSGLLPQISADFRVSEATAGYLTAGYAAIIVVTVIPLSMALARIPRHFLLIALILTFAASNALVAMVSDFGAAMGSRVVGGIAHGLLWSAMAPFVARIVPAHKVGKALAIVFSGNSLGLAIGAPVGTALGNLLGWRCGVPGPGRLRRAAGPPCRVAASPGAAHPRHAAPVAPQGDRPARRQNRRRWLAADADGPLRPVHLHCPVPARGPAARLQHSAVHQRPWRGRPGGHLDRRHHRGLQAAALAPHHRCGRCGVRCCCCRWWEPSACAASASARRAWS